MFCLEIDTAICIPGTHPSQRRYIEVMDGNAVNRVAKWVVIERDKQGEYSGWHFVPFFPEGDHVARGGGALSKVPLPSPKLRYRIRTSPRK